MPWLLRTCSVEPAATDNSLAGEQVFSVGGESSQDPFALTNQRKVFQHKIWKIHFPHLLVRKLLGVARATSLTDVNYAAGAEGTVVILTGNGNFEGVENTSLENPNRIVVDLKEVKKEYKGLQNQIEHF
ncbi:MAG: hypothetical protein R2877_06520 [Bdellovibrionota bacterium]